MIGNPSGSLIVDRINVGNGKLRELPQHLLAGRLAHCDRVHLAREKGCVQVLQNKPLRGERAGETLCGFIFHFSKLSVVVGTPTVAEVGGASSAPGGGLAA